MARFPLRFAPGPGFCLEPGNTGCIEFEFEPSVDGHRSISLSCAGLAPPALLVPTALDFGAAGPGCSPRSRDFQVINTASRSLHFRAIGFGEGTSGEFTIVGASTPGQLIPSGLSRTFTVAYRPEDLGVDVGQVWIELDEEPEPLVVSLVGQGVESTPPCDGSE